MSKPLVRLAIVAGFHAFVLCACSKPAAPAAPAASEAAPPPTPPAVAPASLGGVDLSQQLRVVGGDPIFFQVHIEREHVTFESADRSLPLALPNPGVRATAVEAVWEASEGMDSVTITLTPKACTDGLGPQAYPLSATVAFEGKTYKGCAIREDELGPREGEEEVNQ